MTRWEYMELSTMGGTNMEHMNRLGDQGWEIVFFRAHEDSEERTHTQMVFKRPRQDHDPVTAGRGKPKDATY